MPEPLRENNIVEASAVEHTEGHFEVQEAQEDPLEQGEISQEEFIAKFKEVRKELYDLCSVGASFPDEAAEYTGMKEEDWSFENLPDPEVLKEKKTQDREEEVLVANLMEQELQQVHELITEFSAQQAGAKLDMLAWQELFSKLAIIRESILAHQKRMLELRVEIRRCVALFPHAVEKKWNRSLKSLEEEKRALGIEIGNNSIKEDVVPKRTWKNPFAKPDEELKELRKAQASASKRSWDIRMILQEVEFFGVSAVESQVDYKTKELITNDAMVLQGAYLGQEAVALQEMAADLGLAMQPERPVSDEDLIDLNKRQLQSEFGEYIAAIPDENLRKDFEDYALYVGLFKGENTENGQRARELIRGHDQLYLRLKDVGRHQLEEYISEITLRKKSGRDIYNEFQFLLEKGDVLPHVAEVSEIAEKRIANLTDLGGLGGRFGVAENYQKVKEVGKQIASKQVVIFQESLAYKFSPGYWEAFVSKYRQGDEQRFEVAENIIGEKLTKRVFQDFNDVNNPISVEKVGRSLLVVQPPEYFVWGVLNAFRHLRPNGARPLMEGRDGLENCVQNLSEQEIDAYTDEEKWPGLGEALRLMKKSLAEPNTVPITQVEEVLGGLAVRLLQHSEDTSSHGFLLDTLSALHQQELVYDTLRNDSKKYAAPLTMRWLREQVAAQRRPSFPVYATWLEQHPELITDIGGELETIAHYGVKGEIADDLKPLVVSTQESLLQGREDELLKGPVGGDRLLRALNVYRNLNWDSPYVQALYRERLPMHIREKQGNKFSSMADEGRLLTARILSFNDRNAQELLYRVGEEVSLEPHTKAFVDGVNIGLEGRYAQDAPAVERMVRDHERVLALYLAGNNRSRDLARFASHLFLSLAQDSNLLQVESVATMLHSIAPRLLEAEDAVIRYNGLQIAESLGLQIENMPETLSKLLGGAYAHPETYQVMTRVCNYGVHNFSDEQLARITAGAAKNPNYLANPASRAQLQLLNVRHKGGSIPNNPDIVTPMESFASLGINQDAPFDENTGMYYLYAYADAEGGERLQFTDDRLAEIKELMAKDEVKQEALRQVQSLWHEMVSTDSQDPVFPSELVILGQVAKDNGGVGPLKFVETLAGLVHQVNQTFFAASTQPATRQKLLAGFKAQEERFVAENWSEDDKANFYAISTDILEAAPSLYTEFQGILASFGPSELKQFVREIFPLYQAQLVVMQKGLGAEEKAPKYEVGQLLAMRRSLGELQVSRVEVEGEEVEIDMGERFSKVRSDVLSTLQTGFKDRFGLLQVPEQMGEEKIRTIQNMVRYMGNMKDRTTQKEQLLSFYLGLALNGKWEEFRAGKEVSVDEYVDESRAGTVKDYIEGRKKADSITPELLGVTADELPSFQTHLQTETISQTLGNVHTVDSKLESVLYNVASLADQDAYTDLRDKAMLALYKEHGGVVNAVLAKTYQEASGKTAVFSENERALQKQITEANEVSDWTPGQVKEAQDRGKALGLIMRVMKSIRESGAQEGIEELRKRLTPNAQVIEIFQKTGEDFHTASGAVAVSQDVSYLEGLLVKYEKELQPEEIQVARDYLQAIREQMGELEKVLNGMQGQVQQLASGRNANDPIFTDRLKEIETIFSGKNQVEEVITRVTINWNDIIENMRQCLGCLRKEINNDTNLSFGDNNKFFVLSQSGQRKGSIADQIVFLLPTTIDGQQELTFVMDTLYGNTSLGMVVNHVNAVYKKMKELKRDFPDCKLSILVSRMSSASAPQDVLEQKLSDLLQGASFASAGGEEGLTVTVPTSAAGDNYIEFGGSPRSAGDRRVPGILIRVAEPTASANQ